MRFLTSLAGLILVLYWLVPYIYDLFESIKELFSLWKRDGKEGSNDDQNCGRGSGCRAAWPCSFREMKPEYGMYLIFGAGIA